MLGIRTVATSVLINPECKVLVLPRSKEDPHNPGQVEFPGGSVEIGEEL